MPTCKNCSSHFPNRIWIDGKERNLKSRRFCLTCSPFGKHNTKPLLTDQEGKKCPRCTRHLATADFYPRRDGKDLSPYCKRCTNEQTTTRKTKLKMLCVDYKGGKCVKCGYSRCIAALEFHHRDNKKKKFTISQYKSATITDELRAELDECDLHCANCHRELHWEFNQVLPTGLEPA